MGRRRGRREIIVVKRRLPKVFRCPKCLMESVKVDIIKKLSIAKVFCANCGLSHDFRYSPLLKEVDVFCRFVDWYHDRLTT